MTGDLTFGLGVTAMVALGVLLIVVGYFARKAIGGHGSNVMMVIGAVAILLGGIVYVGIPMGDENEIVVESASWDIACTESENETYLYATEHRAVVAMNYNTTSNLFIAGTGVITLNFSAARADALLTNAICKGYIGSVPTVDVTGAADEYIVDQNSDDSFNALWTKSSAVTAYEDCNMMVEPGDSDYMTLTITLNALAVDAMSQYENVNLLITIGGEVWTISFELVTLSS
jgi:hypothetical protein